MACNQLTGGSDIGTPPWAFSESYQRQNVEISEVYANTADGEAAFIELVSNTDTDLNLDGWYLCTSKTECTRLGAADKLHARARLVLQSDLPALGRHAGVVALKEVGGRVESLLAWGSDAAALAPELSGDAFVTGAWVPGEFVELPYPAPAGVAAIREDGALGCALPSVAERAQPDSSLCLAVDPCGLDDFAPLRISEVKTSMVGVNGWVEIQNASDSALDLAGVRVCALPACVVVGAATVLEPLGRAVLTFGPNTSDSLIENVLGSSQHPVGTTGAAVIFSPGAASANPELDMLSYVQFGETVATYATAAQARCLWQNANAFAGEPRVAGESLSMVGTSPQDPASWQPALETPGEANSDLSAQGWQSCSFPDPALRAAAPDLAVQEITVAETVAVSIENRTPIAYDLQGFTFVLGGETFLMSDTSFFLPAGDVLVLRGETLTRELVSGASQFEILDGEGGLVQFVALSQNAPGAQAAVELGLWPLASCAVGGLPANATKLVRVLDYEGTGAGDYAWHVEAPCDAELGEEAEATAE